MELFSIEMQNISKFAIIKKKTHVKHRVQSHYIIFSFESLTFPANFSNCISLFAAVLLGQVAQLGNHFAYGVRCTLPIARGISNDESDALFILVAHSHVEEINGGDFSGLFAQYSVNIRRMFPIRTISK